MKHTYCILKIKNIIEVHFLKLKKNVHKFFLSHTESVKSCTAISFKLNDIIELHT